jgi:hypothetical protein
MNVEHLQYAGESLPEEELAAVLDLGQRPYEHIVAANSLQLVRRRLERLLLAGTYGEPLRFDEALRAKLPSPPLGRLHERINLQRGIRRAIADPSVAQQVRHDLFAWLEALQLLAAEPLDLTGELPPDTLARFATPTVADILRRLQLAMRQESGGPTFEQAVHRMLDGDFPLAPFVLMEGFTFLTPLHRRFIDACLARGSTVCFIYPFAPAQAHGFALMRRTYAPYAAGAPIRAVPAPALPATVSHLAWLRRALFASEPLPVAAPAPEGSVTLRGYAHRHGEIADCMAQIRAYLDAGTYRPSEIAIVTRWPDEFEMLLQEQARLQGLPTQLAVAPRMLLLTPLGRFALTLYEIRQSGAVELKPAQFAAILASGWLGTLAQVTAGTFDAVRPQCFTRCRKPVEWRAAFDALAARGAPAAGSRLPATLVTSAVLTRWRDALSAVERICERLFAGPEQRMSEHIRLLLDELAQLDTHAIRESERAIITKIGEALTEAAETSSGLRMTAGEFGDVLNSLVKEYGEADPAAATPDNEKVWIARPESIDSFMPAPAGRVRAKKVIFYLALDEQRTPWPAPDPWPFHEDHLDEAREKERYLFLAVVRATGERLHLSYSRTGEETSYRPSIYLEEVSRVLGVPIDQLGLADATECAPAEARARSLGPTPRESYSMHELAQFGLCPYRYQLERLDRRARFCRDDFQIALQAQAEWLRLIFAAARGKTAKTENDLRELFDAAFGQTREAARATFPGIRAFHWRGVEDQVRRRLAFRAATLPESNFHMHVEDWPADRRLEAPLDDRRVGLDPDADYALKRGDIYVLLEDSLLSREWLLPGTAPEEGAPEREPVDALSLFASHYHAVQWWRRGLRLSLSSHRRSAAPVAERGLFLAEAADLIRQLEAGQYPKHPGEHCSWCPVRGHCLGVAETYPA